MLRLPPSRVVCVADQRGTATDADLCHIYWRFAWESLGRVSDNNCNYNVERLTQSTYENFSPSKPISRSFQVERISETATSRPLTFLVVVSVRRWGGVAMTRPMNESSSKRHREEAASAPSGEYLNQHATVRGIILASALSEYGQLPHS